MIYEDFVEIVKKTKKRKPILFELESDKKFSLNEIAIFERENHIFLTEEYKKIISVFGGGYFGFSNIYSLDSESDFYILNNQRDVPKNYLAIADNGCGDYYVIRTENGYCQKGIFFYEHETQQIENTEFMDIFEFLVAVGLKYNECYMEKAGE